MARTRKWRPHGPGSPSGRSLTAETIGKATQKPCPTLEVRFPALVSRRDYALVSWWQTGRRATSHLKTRILRPRQTGPYPAMKRKAITAEVRSQSLNLAASQGRHFLFGIHHGRSWATCQIRSIRTVSDDISTSYTIRYGHTATSSRVPVAKPTRPLVGNSARLSPASASPRRTLEATFGLSSSR